MSFIPDVVAGTVITVAWGNGVRDQLFTSFANAATRNAQVPAPVEGRAAFLEDTDTIVYYDGAAWAQTPGTLIARGNRLTQSTVTTTEVGVMRVPVGVLVAGAAYRISTGSLFMGCTAGATVGASFRFTTDGSNPTTGSATMASVAVDIVVSYQTVMLDLIYVPATAVNLVLLLTVSRSAGSGNAFISGSAITPIDVYVTMANIQDPGDVGVDI